MRKANADLKGDFIVANDGRIGSVNDLYFDDERWGVRYLVVDTGDWLPGRKVLLSPASVDRGASDSESIRVKLNRDQVAHSPSADADQPVSRRFEEAHARYYGHPYYWEGLQLWGALPLPGGAPLPADTQPAPGQSPLGRAEREAGESHLRSAREVAGYQIAAADGSFGHLEDFLVDEERWAIAQLVVDARDWLPSQKVLVPPAAVREIDWEKREVRLRLTREALRRSRAA